MTKRCFNPAGQRLGQPFKRKIPSTPIGNGIPISATFADLIDVMDIAMWELDLNYRVVACNQKAKKVYGENALGDYCYRIAAKRDAVCDNCPAEKVKIGAESGRSQHERIDKAGNTIFIDHIATPIKDSQGNITPINSACFKAVTASAS